MAGSAHRTYAEYQALVETAFTESGIVQILNMKMADMQKHLQEGHLLFSRICSEAYLLYQREGVPLASPNPIPLPTLAKAAEGVFNKVLQKAQDFMTG